MGFEGSYLRGYPSRRAVSEAQQVLRAFLGSPQSRSVVPRPTHTTMAVVDFSEGARSARGMIVGSSQRQAFLVAHGSGTSGVSHQDRPSSMSNGHRTHLSSAGLFIAKDIVDSQFDKRLRMFGVCAGLNDNSDARMIGMHPYGSQYFLKYDDGHYAGIATSHGCPAVSEYVWAQIKDQLDGGFIYIYHPNYTPRSFTARPAQSARHSRVA